LVNIGGFRGVRNTPVGHKFRKNLAFCGWLAWEAHFPAKGGDDHTRHSLRIDAGRYFARTLFP
jgi:hypothetical protein